MSPERQVVEEILAIIATEDDETRAATHAIAFTLRQLLRAHPSAAMAFALVGAELTASVTEAEGA